MLSLLYSKSTGHLSATHLLLDYPILLLTDWKASILFFLFGDVWFWPHTPSLQPLLTNAILVLVVMPVLNSFLEADRLMLFKFPTAITYPPALCMAATVKDFTPSLKLWSLVAGCRVRSEMVALYSAFFPRSSWILQPALPYMSPMSLCHTQHEMLIS